MLLIVTSLVVVGFLAVLWDMHSTFRTLSLFEDKVDGLVERALKSTSPEEVLSIQRELRSYYVGRNETTAPKIYECLCARIGDIKINCKPVENYE